MDFPDVWVSVLLDANHDLETLESALGTLGIGAARTREGWLALDGSFLARLEDGPYPADLLNHPGALEGPTRTHAACLHISGGGFDVERPAFLANTERRVFAGEVPGKSSRFVKIEHLAAVLGRLSRLGEGVVIPQAGCRFVPWTRWDSAGAGGVFGTFVTLAKAGQVLISRGMRLFGVPDLGASIDAAEMNVLSRSLFDAAFEVAWQGFLPAAAARLSAFVDRDAGEWQLVPVAQHGLWMGSSAADATEFALRTNIASLMGSHLFDDPDGPPGQPSIAVFGSPEHRFMTTVGVHRVSRNDGRVEVTAMVPKLSRTAAFALREVGKLIAASGESVQVYHRVALPGLESRGIAGVVLWPSGNIGIGPEERVNLWEAFPVTPSELDRFRAGDQGAWMDAVERQGAFPQLQSRWNA